MEPQVIELFLAKLEHEIPKGNQKSKLQVKMQEVFSSPLMEVPIKSGKVRVKSPSL